MAKAKAITQEELLTSMRQNVAELWTKADVEATFKCGIRPAENALYNLYKKGLIYRHKVNDSETDFGRYAVSIKEENRVIWSKSRNYSDRAKGSRRKEMVTAKELRMMISQIIRSLSSLEDALCPALEQLEERQKQLARIKNLI